jgi:hypothetical protein
MYVTDAETPNRSVCVWEDGESEVTTGAQYPALLLCWMYLLDLTTKRYNVKLFLCLIKHHAIKMYVKVVTSCT